MSAGISFFVGVKRHSIPPLLDYPKTYSLWFVKDLLRKQCFRILYKSWTNSI